MRRIRIHYVLAPFYVLLLVLSSILATHILNALGPQAAPIETYLVISNLGLVLTVVGAIVLIWHNRKSLNQGRTVP